MGEDYSVVVNTFQVRIFSPSGFSSYVSKELSTNNNRDENSIIACTEFFRGQT
jgi:hypothetical protein